MKKLIIVFINILLLITNISVIFADEIDENESDDPDTTETTESLNENKIDKIETNIKDINIKLNNIDSSILNLEKTAGNQGILTNFNLLSEAQFEYYLNNYQNIKTISFDKNRNRLSIFYETDLNFESYQSNLNRYVQTYYKYYSIESNGNVNTHNVYELTGTTATVIFYPDYISDDSEYSSGFLKFNYQGNNLYILNLYTLNIKNNGLSEYSINPNTIYDSGYYSSGQSITITYDNELNDFFGYFEINGNLLSSNTSYTFDITENTNIVINYRAKEGIDYYPYMIYIIILLSFIVILNLFNGGKLYD